MIVNTPDNTQHGPNSMTGGWLRRTRMRSGVTLRRMAVACGMTMYELSRVEQGWGKLTPEQRNAFMSAIHGNHMTGRQ